MKQIRTIMAVIMAVLLCVAVVAPLVHAEGTEAAASLAACEKACDGDAACIKACRERQVQRADAEKAKAQEAEKK
ncbi:hypothetical protein [Salidesulfovibrio onnuriiensis]|uniref:hypothetical protein n=1 Tax=Salidesulfovibrio onnuriiensis TaxID=2583823 RepID=UPI0011CA4A1E|nr:hypothetical protein [Salidesulfovibrio onnuriiensis]